MNIARVVLLGEDRAHEGFLREIAKQCGWRVVQPHIAPSGRGDASAWVLRQVPVRLRELRAVRCADPGLLVAIDGDRHGVAGRRRGVAGACKERGVAPPKPGDPIAALIPTRSIDTWAVFLCRELVDVDEQRSCKRRAARLFATHPAWRSPGVPAEDAPRFWKPDVVAKLATGFLRGPGHPELPSLDAGRAALRALGAETGDPPEAS